MISLMSRHRAGFLRSLRRVMLLCVAIFLLACIGCASFQRKLIYHPPVLTAEKVEEFASSQKLERWQTAAGKTIGWKRLSPIQPAKGRILITHGNGGAAVQCSHYADTIQKAASLDVYVVEYPGYADRPGKPTEQSLDSAAEEAFHVLAQSGPVYLVGESLGTGVAAHLAGCYPDQVAGVALLAPYNRLAAVAQAHMPILPVSLLLRDRYPAEIDLRHYQGPVAVLVGGHDILVPERFGRRLYDGYTGPKRLWHFPKATHKSLMFRAPEVWDQVVTFWLANSADHRGIVRAVESHDLAKQSLASGFSKAR